MNSCYHIDYFKIMCLEVVNIVASITAKIGAVVAPILALIYGILVLVPAGPFDHRDVTMGVVLIVLSLFAVMSLIGYFVGFCLGYMICGIVVLMYYVVLGIVALLVMCYEGIVSCCDYLSCTKNSTKNSTNFATMA